MFEHGEVCYRFSVANEVVHITHEVQQIVWVVVITGVHATTSMSYVTSAVD